MEICNHIIKESEVVGIGPLMSQRSGDAVMSSLYNSKQFWFYLHLRNQSLKIESDFVALQGQSDEMINKNREHLKAFEKLYQEAKVKVQHLIIDKKTARI